MMLIYTASRQGSRITRNSLPTTAGYSENILSEAAVKKKYRFDDATWASLGDNEALIEKIEAEKTRRIRNGDTKRERAQVLVTQAPDVLGGIMLDASASPKHRIKLRQGARRIRS